MEVEQVLKGLMWKHSGEPEFLQAVKEVLMYTINTLNLKKRRLLNDSPSQNVLLCSAFHGQTMLATYMLTQDIAFNLTALLGHTKAV